MTRLWSKMRETKLFRYGVAVVAVAAALGLRLILAEFTELDSPFLLFFAAVVLASVYGGLGPGLVSATLSALACDFFFIGPPYHLGVATSEQHAQITSFFIEGIMLSVMGALLRRERRRAEAADAAARRLEQRILDISEDERRRIGHDLHDGLGQHLTGIALLSKALRQRLAAMSLPEAQQAEQIAEFVSESIGWTRDLARGLSPITIEADGLPPALEELATNASKLLGVKCICRCDVEAPLDGEASLHLYRIAQEAINNSVKHGRADSIEVALAVTDQGGVKITIADDGVGLSEKTRSNPGLGLQIMQYRAKMIGATLSVNRASPQRGTIVACTVPASRTKKVEASHDPSQSASLGNQAQQPVGQSVGHAVG
jgi:signal transduction histidine kinase